MAYKFKSEGIRQIKAELEVEIKKMLSILDDIEKESRDMDDAWQGSAREAFDRNVKNFSSQAQDMVHKTNDYTQHLEYILNKYPSVDSKIQEGLQAK